MKTNFKKTLAVLLAVLMLTSVFSVTVFAAYTAKIQAGSADGSTLKATLADGTPITEDMLSLTTNASNKLTLPSEAYFEREDYIQDGWTKTANGGGTLLKFGATQTVRNNSTKFYPHWKKVVFEFSIGAGSNYNPDDPNNYTDSTMTTLKGYSFTVNTLDDEPIVLPGAMFTREGYTQTGWSTSKVNNGTGTKYELNSVYKKEITADVNLYPFWTPMVYTVKFLGGADGVGTAQEYDVNYNATTVAPGAIFTRDGYTQIGWATIEGSDTVEISLGGTTPKVLDNLTYYPVWRQDIFSVSVDKTEFKFGRKCIGYNSVESQTFTITNEGNTDIQYTLPLSSNYDISVKSGDSLIVAPGKTVTFIIAPKDGLSIKSYNSTLIFSCSKSTLDVEVMVAFTVVDHSFGKYIYNNDATYTKDGTKSADCLNGCGTKDTVTDLGSMKIYSADNNDAVGLAPSYEHHRTVRFTAYGSGMDDTENYLTKRFRPVSWYVNDDFNGEFEDGYDVVFTHTLFGEYTLTINYVEEEFDAATGEWVATDVTDTKTFDYTVGATEKEEQEIVRPNTILNIIFGLFAQLLALLGIGG